MGVATEPAAPEALLGVTSRHRLVTIRFSHYCEKARWALDRAGLVYEEEAHPPLVGWFHTKRIRTAKGRARQVPILLVGDDVYPDSNEIVRYADARTPAGLTPLLAGRGDVEDRMHSELRKLFDDGLGPAARRVVYYHLLSDTKVASRILASAGPPLERRLARAAFPLLRAAIRRGLKIDAAGFERSRRVIARAFAAVEERVKDGRPYLLGDSFSAADLSFAALCAPLVFPEAYVAFAMPLEEGPRALVPIVEEYRDTVAGRFAMSLYERERAVTAAKTKGND